jgi:hypothetical protein
MLQLLITRKRQEDDGGGRRSAENGVAMRMQTMRRVRMATIAWVVVLLFCQGMISGQAQQRSPGSSYPGQPTMPKPGTPTRDPVGLPGMGRDSDTDPMLDKLAAQQAKSRNLDRQKRLEADTERLLALATDLKQQVDKTDKNILSVDVIKKAEEIERLAKSVKERMKG